MKKGQTLKTPSGVECVLFPMLYMNITQGINGSFSHKGDMALDLAGKDAGIDPIFMPCKMKVVWKDPKIGGVLYQSVAKVHMADGTEDYIHMLTLHDNDISDLAMNKTFKQGTETGDEGIAGKATGNHVHFVIGLGKYSGGYPMVKNKYGTWVLPKQKDPRKIVFINETIIKNDKGYDFKTYKAPFKSKGKVQATENGIRIRTAPNLKTTTNTGTYFNKGETVSYVSVVQGDGWYFAKYKNKSGKYRYVALCKIDGSSKYWKQV